MIRFGVLGRQLIVCILLSVFGLAGTTQAQTPIDERLKNSLEPLIKRHRGEVGLAIRNLKSGVHYEFNADTPMPTASLIKLPMMVTTYRLADAGKVDLDKPIELKEGVFWSGNFEQVKLMLETKSISTLFSVDMN